MTIAHIRSVLKIETDLSCFVALAQFESVSELKEEGQDDSLKELRSHSFLHPHWRDPRCDPTRMTRKALEFQGCLAARQEGFPGKIDCISSIGSIGCWLD